MIERQMTPNDILRMIDHAQAICYDTYTFCAVTFINGVVATVLLEPGQLPLPPEDLLQCNVSVEL